MNDIETIANHYGLTAQLDQTVEECAELIQAINKYKRDPCRKTRNHVAEEIADVSIMLVQLIYLLGVGRITARFKCKKIRRQIKRVDKQKKKEFYRNVMDEMVRRSSDER
jgi:NTP pyrophosphatase (non-canonical NTP hydrolase)